MNTWIMKSEPSVFSIDDLAARPHQTEPWDGIRNYQVRNMLRDRFRPGDLAFFYHSSCPAPGIVGLMEVVSEGYPDPTAFDPASPAFDPQSQRARPRWFCVDVKLIRKFAVPISLKQMRATPALEGLAILRRGCRLSITPVNPAHRRVLLSLEEKCSRHPEWTAR